LEVIGQRRATGFADAGIGLCKSMFLLRSSDQEKRRLTAAEQAAIIRARMVRSLLLPGTHVGWVIERAVISVIRAELFAGGVGRLLAALK
jgi:hypothetical protein